jgi:hypothetical protein
VTEAEAKAVADSFGYPYIETSAKNADNVHEAFVLCVRQINKWRDDHPEEGKKRKGKCPLL